MVSELFIRDRSIRRIVMVVMVLVPFQIPLGEHFWNLDIRDRSSVAAEIAFDPCVQDRLRL